MLATKPTPNLEAAAKHFGQNPHFGLRYAAEVPQRRRAIEQATPSCHDACKNFDGAAICRRFTFSAEFNHIKLKFRLSSDLGRRSSDLAAQI